MVKEEKEKPYCLDIYLIIWGPYFIATDSFLVSGLKKYTAFLRYVTYLVESHLISKAKLSLLRNKEIHLLLSSYGDRHKDLDLRLPDFF